MSRRGATLQPSQWLLAPTLGAVAATVLLSIPFRALSIVLPEPVLPLALAFAWALIRPSVLGPILLFLLGVFLDLFWGDRMGLWGLSLLSAYGLSLGGRSLMAGQGAGVMAAWYLAACALGLWVAYVFATMVSHEEPNLFALGWQFFWTVALFPGVYWLVERFEDADVRFR